MNKLEVLDDRNSLFLKRVWRRILVKVLGRFLDYIKKDYLLKFF